MVPLAGAGCDGVPKPDDGAVVVVVAPPGHEFEPEPAHCADGAVVVVVVVDFLVFFGVGHLAGGVGEG
ncbi:MAG TPA: hypothetical protein VJ456_03270, partial [Acidimicrobiia bacterium]|nr:hypothetical protein [Acidimicrobiia bacterium]